MYKHIKLFSQLLSIRDEENEKRRVSKGRVIDELIQTEMDYYKVMKLLYDVYLGPSSEKTVSFTEILIFLIRIIILTNLNRKIDRAKTKRSNILQFETNNELI